MLRHSAERLAAHPAIDAIFVVIGDGQQEMANDALDGLNIAGYAIGGATRRESVLNGLSAAAQAGAAKHILIHDAARPTGCFGT